MTLLDTTWSYTLTQTTEDKSVPRPGVRQFSPDLIGVDGSLRGGLRPVRGFELAWELDFFADAEHDSTSEVTDVRPVNFRRSDSDYAYGFVYRARRSSLLSDPTVADVFVDLYDTQTDSWCTGMKIGEGVDPSVQFDVQVFGRLCYVFIQGRSPILFYVDQGSTATPPTSIPGGGSSSSSSSSSSGGCSITLTVLGREGLPPLPGPGLRNRLASPESAGPLGSIFDTGDPDRPGAGQVVLTNTAPENLGLFKELEDDNPFTGSGSADTGLIGNALSPRVVWTNPDSNGVTQNPFVLNVPVQTGQVVLVFVSGRAVGTFANSAISFEVRLENPSDGTVVATATLVPDSSVEKLKNEYTTVDASRVFAAWYSVVPPAGTYTVRVITNSESNDDADGVEEQISVLVVDNVDPTAIVTETFTSEGTFTGTYNGPTIDAWNTNDLLLVGSHVSRPQNPVEPHDVLIPEDTSDPARDYAKLTTNELALYQPLHFTWGALNLDDSLAGTILLPFTIDPTDTPRYALSSILRLETGSEASSSSSSSSSSTSEVPYSGPSLVAYYQRTAENATEVFVPDVTVERDDLILCWTVVRHDTLDERDITCQFGGTNLRTNVFDEDGVAAPARIDSDLFGMRNQLWWGRAGYTLPSNGSIPYPVGTATVQMFLQDVDVPREALGLAVAVIRGVRWSILDPTDSTSPVMNPFSTAIFTRALEATTDVELPILPRDDGTSQLLVAGGFSTSPLNALSKNNEWFDAQLTNHRMKGDFLELSSDYTERALGYDFFPGPAGATAPLALSNPAPLGGSSGITGTPGNGTTQWASGALSYRWANTGAQSTDWMEMTSNMVAVVSVYQSKLAGVGASGNPVAPSVMNVTEGLSGSPATLNATRISAVGGAWEAGRIDSYYYACTNTQPVRFTFNFADGAAAKTAHALIVVHIYRNVDTSDPIVSSRSGEGICGGTQPQLDIDVPGPTTGKALFACASLIQATAESTFTQTQNSTLIRDLDTAADPPTMPTAAVQWTNRITIADRMNAGWRVTFVPRPDQSASYASVLWHGFVLRGGAETPDPPGEPSSSSSSSSPSSSSSSSSSSSPPSSSSSSSSSSSPSSSSSITGGDGLLPDSLIVGAGIAGLFGGDSIDFDALFRVFLLSPNNGGTNVSVDVELRWDGRYTDGRPDPSTLVYDVYLQEVESQAELVRVAQGLTVESFDPGTVYARGRLPFGKTFRWKVVARLSDVPEYPGISSETRTFTTKAAFDARPLEPGDYVFGYILHDSRTGRTSAFSEVAQCRSADFPLNGNDDTSRLEQYAAIEILYDSEKYDQASIYRSVKTQDAGGTLIAAWQQLDKIIDLRTYWTTNNGSGQVLPYDQPYRQSIYYYRLEDKQLVYQPVWADLSLFDAGMPRGGTAVLYQNALMVGAIKGGDSSTTEENRQSDAFTGIGELRWSVTNQVAPELFPPQNRYTPAVPSNEIIKLETIGGNCLGFSKDRMYHMRRIGPQLDVREMHEGFLGLVNYKATASAGSAIYCVTSKGIKTVDGFAKLDALHAADKKIKEDWVNDLASVSVAYDPLASILFIHNPVQEETILIWFETAMMTELHDTPFTEVTTGAWPTAKESDGTFDYSEPLSQRAFFLQNSPDLSTSISGWKPRLFVLNHEKDKTISGSTAHDDQPRYSLLHPTGDLRFTVKSTATLALPSGNTYTVAVDINDTTLGTRLEGCYLYVLSGTNRGARLKVIRKLGLDTLVVASDASTILSADDRIGLSPVLFQWTGANVGLSKDDRPFAGEDFHRLKQVNDLKASFIDVVDFAYSGEADSPDAFYEGLVYVGDDSLPVAVSAPLDGARQTVRSVRNIESEYPAAFGASADYERREGVLGASLSPGLRVYCPDLGFRLLSCLVSGRISPSTTSEVPGADSS